MQLPPTHFFSRYSKRSLLIFHPEAKVLDVVHQAYESIVQLNLSVQL